MGLRSRRPAFAYPTSASFVANVCLGVAVSLTLLGALLHLSPLGLPAFWLAAPAALAFVAAWAMGPGMREEFVFDPETKAVLRRVRTLGIPKDEEVFGRDQVRLMGVARMRDEEADQDGGAYVVMVDRRGRWLALTHTHSLERARRARDEAARALGVPGVEYRCGADWTPFWGRIQPPPPPESSKLGPPGEELGPPPPEPDPEPEPVAERSPGSEPPAPE